MLGVVALFDHTTVPEQPCLVRVRLCPFVIVAGLVTDEVILSAGAVTTLRKFVIALVALQLPLLAKTL